MYFGLALFCTGLFVAQFLISLVFSDMDTDVDLDGDGSTDLDLSGIISFKGLLHFGIGFSWSMWFARGTENQLLAAIVSVGIGILTAIILALTYWAALKLKKEIIPEKGDDLVGRKIEIYYKLTGTRREWRVMIEINGGIRNISVMSESGKNYTPGEISVITKYQRGKYWIP